MQRRTREGDHVLLGESLRGEERGEVDEPRRRRRDVVVGAAEARRRGVPSPDLDVPARPAQDDDAVPGGDGEDVRAGDDAGAHLLHGRPGGVDDLEASDGAVVGRRHLLALEAGRVIQQQRRVAALHAR